MITSKAQIIATLGPASENPEVLKSLINHQVDVIRLNFSWADLEARTKQIHLVRSIEKECGRCISIIIDLPGPRLQEQSGHTYDHHVTSSVTLNDEHFIKFAVDHNVDYVALSFVGSAEDVKKCRALIQSFSGTQMIIAKIERKEAFESLDEIIVEADAIMIARGDLGNEFPLEQLPFIQDTIIKKSNKAGKPVIVATQMLLSMTENPEPTRAEVTDVANAILEGADAVMLSEETAKGKYPVEAVTMMEKIVLETEQHLIGKTNFNVLKHL